MGRRPRACARSRRRVPSALADDARLGVATVRGVALVGDATETLRQATKSFGEDVALLLVEVLLATVGVGVVDLEVLVVDDLEPVGARVVHALREEGEHADVGRLTLVGERHEAKRELVALGVGAELDLDDRGLLVGRGGQLVACGVRRDCSCGAHGVFNIRSVKVLPGW